MYGRNGYEDQVTAAAGKVKVDQCVCTQVFKQKRQDTKKMGFIEYYWKVQNAGVSWQSAKFTSKTTAICLPISKIIV